MWFKIILNLKRTFSLLIDKAAVVKIQIISEYQVFILISTHERYEVVIITHNIKLIFQSWVENASPTK